MRDKLLPRACRSHGGRAGRTVPLDCDGYRHQDAPESHADRIASSFVIPGRPTPAPPEGFDRIDTARTRAWVRPEARDWVEAAIARHGDLYSAARTQAGAEGGLEGRAPVYRVTADAAQASVPGGSDGSPTRVIRHYVRGGAVASLLGDRYLRWGMWRPMAETVASERLRTSGLPTPRVLAAAVYFSGLVYRGDLVTEYVATCGDLAELLFQTRDSVEPEDRAAALRAVGATVRKMAELGLRHPDVNVKNFLVETRTEPVRVHLLDLDRCRFGSIPLGRPVKRMASRLTASLRKWEKTSGRPLSAEEWEALREGLREGAKAWVHSRSG